MLRRCVPNDGTVIARRCAPVLLLFLGLATAPLSRAQTNLGPVTVGAGLRTSFVDTEPTGGDSTDKFLLNDIRLYVNGPVYGDIKFMFNTDYDGATNKLEVLDAVARIEINPMFNIWAGRFLPPSDRANLNGPFYANEWLEYTDGIQDGYPFVSQGRDNGAAYWGDFKAGTVKMKLSAGAFDGHTADGISSIIWAARAQFDFWDPENGYYLNGTYYGDKNLLALGGATEVQNYKTASTVDFLMERKVMNGGAFTVEAEYSRYNRLGGYNSDYGKSEGGYGLVSILLPKVIGVGKFQALGKFAEAEFTDGIGSPESNPSYRQKTTEVDLGYIMKQFDARVYAFGKVTDFNNAVMKDFWDTGVGLQFQLSKQILGAK